MTAELRSWLIARSGLAMAGILAGAAVVAAGLIPALGNLPAGIVTALYLGWLGLASYELRMLNRGRWKKPVAELAAAYLVGFALFILPALMGSLGLAGNGVSTWVRVTFVIGLVVVCDHFAIGLVGEKGSWLRSAGTYAAVFLLLLMPPFALFFLQPRLRAFARGSADSISPGIPARARG